VALAGSEPSAHVLGGLLSEQVGDFPSEHFGGFPVAVPVAHFDGGYLSAHVGLLPSVQLLAPL